MTFRSRALVLSLVVVLIALATRTSAVANGVRYRDEIFSSVTVTSNIAYGQAPDENGQPVTLTLDVYRPAGDTQVSRPVFVWIHGGGFTDGDKADPLDTMIATRFAKRGYVTASINYRLRPGHYFVEGDPELALAVLDAQHDAQAAVRWLRANATAYGIDASRIDVAGYSAGAITSLQVAYHSEDPGDSGNPGYPSTVSSIIDISGAMDTTLIDAGEPPVMAVHGTADTRVAYSNALDVVARAQAVGVPVEFHPLEGVSHDVWTPDTEQIISWMSFFLYRQLVPLAVGGIAEAPDAAASPLESGDSSASHDGLAGVAAAAVIVIGVGGWYAKRHYSVGRK
jgi:acetyl esterase/lipase